MDDPDLDNDEHDDLPYESWDKLDFGIITNGLKQLPFFKDDLYLGMQAMNESTRESRRLVG